jgi:voltage-gated potassium channel
LRFGAIELDRTRLALLERTLDSAVIVAAVATVPLVIAEELGLDPTIVAAVDWAVWLVFLAEYIVLLAVAPRRSTFVRQHWLAAGVIVLSFPGWPGALELARLARLGRLLRMAFVTWRALSTLRAVFGRRELVEVGVVAAGVTLLGGAVLTIIEPETVKGDLGAGIWWAAVTATTVGYGDVTPSTVAGRITAVVVMVVGIGAVSTLIAAIAGHFVQQDRGDDLKDLREQLARIEARLEQLAEERERR